MSLQNDLDFIPSLLLTQGQMNQNLPTLITAHSATAAFNRLESGVVEVEYRGNLTADSLRVLRERVIFATSGAKMGMVARFDSAMLFCNFEPDDYGYRLPVAMIVSTSQYEDALQFSRAAADAGVMRAVLFSEQLEMARRWTLRHCLLDLV